jgi:lysozyme family protein
LAQSNFERSLSAVLRHEGGYVDHPKDPGGATNRGITIANFRRYVKPGGTKADLKKLTEEQASAVYRKGFWAVLLADDLPSGVDYAVFDYGVNSGPARAAKALQTIVGAKADGVIGPKTIAAVEVYANKAELIEELCAQRLAFVKRLKTWPTFGKGWERRIAGVRKLALEMAQQPPVATPDEPTQPKTETPAGEAAKPSTGFRPNWLKIGLWAAAILILVFALT